MFWLKDTYFKKSSHKKKNCKETTEFIPGTLLNLDILIWTEAESYAPANADVRFWLFFEVFGCFISSVLVAQLVVAQLVVRLLAWHTPNKSWRASSNEVVFGASYVFCEEAHFVAPLLFWLSRSHTEQRCRSWIGTYHYVAYKSRRSAGRIADLIVIHQ